MSIAHPKEPLRGPYILWDSRSWDGTLNTVGALPNQGSAGSDYDLLVESQVVGDPGERRTLGKFALGVDPTIPMPVTFWDDIGGEPCDAPFTFVMAFGDLVEDGVFQATFFSGSDQSNADFSTGGSGTVVAGGALSGGAIGGSINLLDGPPFPNAGWGQPSPSSAGDAALYLENRLIVLTFDPIDGGASFWRGGVPVAPTALFPVTGERWYIPSMQPNACGASIDGDRIGASLGRDIITVDPDDPPPPFTRWNGCFGYALFRGEPNAFDIAIWSDFFFLL